MTLGVSLSASGTIPAVVSYKIQIAFPAGQAWPAFSHGPAD